MLIVLCIKNYNDSEIILRDIIDTNELEDNNVEYSVLMYDKGILHTIWISK